MEITGKKVLIIDDNRDLVELLQIHLESAGLEVFSAHEKKQALQQLSARPDVIILDLILKDEEDGIDVLAEIRARESSRETPVIVLSRKIEERERVLCEGAQCFMEKPYDARELISRIGKLCGKVR